MIVWRSCCATLPMILDDATWRPDMKRTLELLLLSLILATMLHVDWHLARPLHHRLSLAWPLHWVVTALVFAVVGWWVGRRAHGWRAASLVFVAAVVLAQVIEPVLEVLLYEGRLGYPADPGRWPAFLRATAAATPAYFGCVWLCGREAMAARTGTARA
jgi:hypothetical protein